MYQAVLASEPENAEALHWFGVLHHQLGDDARAIKLIDRAISLEPDKYLYHGNRAEVLQAKGDYERAVESHREALRLWPDFPEAHCNLGTALQSLGRFEEAAASLRRAIELRPTFAVAVNNLGIVLRELGQAEEAVELFRRAAELEPGYAPARTNLGQALLNSGRAEEALTHCEEAVRLDPDSAEIHDNLGNVLRALDRLDESWNSHWQALRINRKFAMANAHIGLILQRRGHLGEALPWLKMAAELKPEDPTLWQWLAELHDEKEDPAESIPCWRRVLELDPRRVSAKLSMGRALQEEGRLQEARECYLSAIEIEPDAVLPYLSLGGLYELLGKMDQAEASFRMALAKQPDSPMAYARLATLLRGQLPAEDLAALEARLDGPDLADGPRGQLLFAYAHVKDAHGDFRLAAECLARANAIALEQAKDRPAYQVDQHVHYVGDLIQAFDRGLFDRLAGAGSESSRPVFVFGLPRSGTTLIEQVLASHSQVYGAGELRLSRRSFEAIPTALGQPDASRDCIAGLHSSAVNELARKHLDSLAQIDGGRSARIVDKMPDNYLYLGLLAILFPRAVFIHCRRDLRDVAVSCWMTNFSSIRWANDPNHIASRFRQYVRIMDHWAAVLPVSIHHVDYEETVGDLEGVARRLIGACGLEWEPACLEFHRTERPVRTASVTQVRQPIYRRSLERWRNYETTLAELFALLPESNEQSPRG